MCEMRFVLLLLIATAVKSKEIKLATDRIVGGQIAEPHSIPFQVAMLIRKGDKGSHLCGGSLISEKFVLTAAHCLHEAEKAFVIIGAHDLSSNETGVVRQSVTSSNFKIHPQFNIEVAFLDLALVELPTPVNFSKTIQPVSLPSGFLFDESFSGEIGTVSGFGQTCDDRCGPSQVLRFTLNRILLNEECEKSFGFNAIPTETQICLSTSNDKSGNCRGDSGGPVTIFRDDTTLQIGLSSFGFRKCQEGHPTVFTRLTKSLVEWINEEVAKGNEATSS